MFCPSCREEFPPFVYRCRACDVALVVERPKAEPSPARDVPERPGCPPSLTVVLATADIAFLQVAKSILDSAGIPFVVRGEHGLAMEPVMAPLGRASERGAQISVPADRAEEAAELLRPPD